MSSKLRSIFIRCPDERAPRFVWCVRATMVSVWESTSWRYPKRSAGHKDDGVRRGSLGQETLGAHLKPPTAPLPPQIRPSTWDAEHSRTAIPICAPSKKVGMVGLQTHLDKLFLGSQSNPRCGFPRNVTWS